MRLKVALLVIALSSLLCCSVNPQTADHLSACWEKQCEPFQSKALHLTYTETLRQLYHSQEPWQTMAHTTSGSAWFTEVMFENSDTSRSARGAVSFAYSAFDSTSLLAPARDNITLIPVTKSNWFDAMFESARYSPVILLDYFHRHAAEVSKRIDSGLALYSLKINKTVVTLAIRLSDDLVESVRTLQSDDLLGDAQGIYSYPSYRTVDGASIPDSTETAKIDGKIKGGVRVLSAEIVDKAPTLIAKPANFQFAEEKIEKPQISVEKFSDRIHFIDILPADSRSMIVEFPNFLLVVDAPLSSKNGELIIEEAKKIAPDKPIRYFAFGHHHPSYLGGFRPFVYRGATILTTAEDTPYVNFLASAPRSLDPDSLYLHPAQLHIKEIGDSLTISDGGYLMKIYLIGNKSIHTSDYLVFYFPKEKMLWEDDLAWVKKDGPVEKAIERQAGLVNAIKDLGLHPKTVVQSWPLVQYGMKTIIPFSDLEASMNPK